MSAQQIPQYRKDVFQPKARRYAICVFVINEGERIRAQLGSLSEYADIVDVIVADGGSTDGSLDPDFLKQNRVRALLTKTGPGKLSAQMRMALSWCMSEGYDGCIVVDGNNKDDMSAVPLFAGALDRGFDHVQGSRHIRGGKAINTPLSRAIGVRLLHAPVISIAAGYRYTDTTNGFRAYSRRLLEHPQVQPFRDIFVGYELHYYLAIRAARLGLKVTEVPVTRSYPRGKVPTKISPFKGNLLILKTLFRAASGYYDPRGPQGDHA